MRPEQELVLEDLECVIGRELASAVEKGTPIRREDLT
jgi:sialic acid synthase SpsE